MTLQSNAMLKDSIAVRRTVTMSPSIEICTLSSLSLLPTSAPATPQDAVDKFLKTTKSSCDLKTLMRKKAKCLAAIEYIEKYMDAETFIEKLQEEKRAEKQRELEEQKREEEKRLVEKKHQEWLQYVRESNNSGYFPGYSGSDCFFCKRTCSENYSTRESDQNLVGNTGRGHMDF
jgi:tRNA A37 threonylcarbamoyladenosine modification protein TsaB